jgi:hypothetical protein
MSAALNPYNDSLNGSSASATIGFYGATPITQPSARLRPRLPTRRAARQRRPTAS